MKILLKEITKSTDILQSMQASKQGTPTVLNPKMNRSSWHTHLVDRTLRSPPENVSKILSHHTGTHILTTSLKSFHHFSSLRHGRETLWKIDEITVTFDRQSVKMALVLSYFIIEVRFCGVTKNHTKRITKSLTIAIQTHKHS